MTSKKGGYLGNANLKPAGIGIEFTKDQVKEYMLQKDEEPKVVVKDATIFCKDDQTYFCDDDFLAFHAGMISNGHRTVAVEKKLPEFGDCSSGHPYEFFNMNNGVSECSQCLLTDEKVR